jgi:hypothetical protein
MDKCIHRFELDMTIKGIVDFGKPLYDTCYHCQGDFSNYRCAKWWPLKNANRRDPTEKDKYYLD